MSSNQEQSQQADRAAEQYKQGYLPPVEQQALGKDTSGKMDEMPMEQQNVYLPTEWNPEQKGGVTKYKAAGKMQGKRAVITGGDSGIGRSVSG